MRVSPIEVVNKTAAFHPDHGASGPHATLIIISLGIRKNGLIGKLGSQLHGLEGTVAEAVRDSLLIVSTASSAAISPERCPPMPSHTTANVTRVVFDELTWQVVML